MHDLLFFFKEVAASSWHLFLEAAPYIIFGIVVGGMLKMFLSPDYVARHLGRGRFRSVLKAALLGIPIPLCSCGVLPAAAALKKQGANNGATTAFLISTPESGVDSISVSYALLDPIMTIARPVSAFITAMVAGVLENFLFYSPEPVKPAKPASGCQCGSCAELTPINFPSKTGIGKKVMTGMRYAFGELWAELAGWFFIGILCAGVIMAAVPDDMIADYLGGGAGSMLIMLIVGIPLYICATASTPIAAALILKGVSPGTALVFLLVGPATNITSLSVLVGLLGRRSILLYLASIASISVICGLLLDSIYLTLGISAQAVVGKAAEVVPYWLQLMSAVVILIISYKPLKSQILGLFNRTSVSGCGCSSADSCCSSH